MQEFIIVISCVLLLAMVFSKIAYRFGIPSLILFLGMGMLFGSDGIVKIHFDDFVIAEQICSFALLMIIFYGGFETNWNKAKPVVIKSVIMSTVGTFITAGLTGLFCFYILKMSFWEAMLIGSVLSSTDAASVFSILKSNNLNFKFGLASLLEMESGSNDPMSYMLSVICIQILTMQSSTSIPLLLIKQVVFGVGIGILSAYLCIIILKRFELHATGLYPIFMLGMVLFSFEISLALGGNGYICAYLFGIIIGNQSFPHKKSIRLFFDGIGWLMQILLFFTLGLLSFPSQFVYNFIPGLFIAMFITFIARPIATALLFTPFHMPFQHQLLVNWVGFRGAASIAFSIMAVSKIPALENDLFHIVFLVSIFTVTLQGTLLPLVARKLNLVEEEESVWKTFTDYEEGHLSQLYEMIITSGHDWENKKIMEANIDKNLLIVGVKRGNQMLMPKGDLCLETNDTIIFSQRDV
ncbi:potassium/proton antiporter [Candidatus Stoquefichus massiliensis]|uniref:potassium/proton antiporter n=1 Tax=Candidatus Stoquefichus massiliensis TaxID=1470350 RepID=UPI000489E042|nr:potassium/proton antiporter [Candidatus Stoquefichus massiliensis]